MDPEEIQKVCLDRMHKGDMGSEERIRCFEEFETTHPNSESLQKFYDLWGLDYDTDMSYAGYMNPQMVCKELVELYPHQKDIKILDIGAGTGEIAKILHLDGYTEIDGADASRVMLHKAQDAKVYKHLHHETLTENKKFRNGEVDGVYDVIISAGSFYPHHLKGDHIHCFVNCVKPGGHLILSSAPTNDEGVGMRDVLHRLVQEGIVTIVKEINVPKWFRDDDGIVWVLRKI